MKQGQALPRQGPQLLPLMLGLGFPVSHVARLIPEVLSSPNPCWQGS